MSGLQSYLNVYDFNTVLPGSKEEIKYKGLSTNTMKKLLIYENEKDPLKEENILDHILKLSLIGEYDIDKMYVLDRYYLLIKIREATKGSNFTFTFNCPKCKSQTIINIDLKDLIIEKTDVKNDEINLFNDTLKMKLDFPTREKQKENFSIIDKKQSVNNKMVDIQLANLVSMITYIEGKDGEIKINTKELMKFIGDLPEMEKIHFDNWIETNKFGINLNYKLKCNNCDYSKIKDLPMTSFFS